MRVSAAFWRPMAAYLYALHLDGPGLAWEYLRRHPDYRRDWCRCRRAEVASRWGLRLLEDPDLDAREAHPAWCSDPVSMLLQADADPPPDANVLAIWRLPGRKHLLHDGRRLLLTSRWPGSQLRFAMAPGLDEGMAYVHAVRGTADGQAALMLAGELAKLAAGAANEPAAVSHPRPTAAALLELHTLQALDAVLAGASSRELAEGLFGAEAIAQAWHADGGLRSRVRRLIRRGRALMHGGYRRLAQLAPVGEGRLAAGAERP